MKSKREIDDGIAEIFKGIRKNRGLSKAKMADLLYIDDKTWAAYESGKTSPSIGEFVWICNQLGEAVLKPVLDLVYPDTYKNLEATSDIGEIRAAAAHYLHSVASDKTVREWAYICFGQHGSNIEPQMQLFTMIDHLPLEYRVMIARLTRHCWDMAAAKGDIVCPEHVMPDVGLLDLGIQRAHESAVEGLKSYSTAAGENAS